MDVDIKFVREHCEVYIEGKFEFSADNEQEAKQELAEQYKINV